VYETRPPKRVRNKLDKMLAISCTVRLLGEYDRIMYGSGVTFFYPTLRSRLEKAVLSALTARNFLEEYGRRF